MEEAERLADRIVIIDHGKVIADDTRGRPARAAARHARIRVPRPHGKEPAGLMSLIACVAMVRKDLRMFFSDRRAVIMAFAVPIAIASFFGSIFQGRSADDEAARIPIAMVDQDGSVISKAILDGVRRTRTCSHEAAAREARDSVRRGNDTVAVVIPPGFGDAAGRAFFGGTAESRSCDFLYDPSRAMELAMVRGVMTQHVMEAVSKEMFSGQGSQSVIDDTLKQLDSALLNRHAGRRKEIAARHADVDSAIQRPERQLAASIGHGQRAAADCQCRSRCTKRR